MDTPKKYNKKISIINTKKYRKTKGQKRRNRRQQTLKQNSRSRSPSSKKELVKCDNECEDRVDIIHSIIVKLFKFTSMFLRLGPNSVVLLLKLTMEIMKLLKQIYQLPVVGRFIVLFIFYILWTNPYTRIILDIFINVFSAIWNLSIDVGIESYIKEQCDKFKILLENSFTILVQYLEITLVANLSPKIAEYIGKILFNKYLEGGLTEISNELIKLRVQNSDLALQLEQMQSNFVDNSNKLLSIENESYRSGDKLLQLENTIQTLAGTNNALLQGIQSEIGGVGRLIMYDKDVTSFRTNTHLMKIENLLVTNLRTTDAGRFLNNFLPNSLIQNSELPVSNVLTAAAAVGSVIASRYNTYRRGSLLKNQATF